VDYWDEPLFKNPSLKLSLFEPDKGRLRKARQTALGKNVRYLSDLIEISNL
jgi:hypothetical protein